MHQFFDTLLSINPDISGVSYMDVLGSPLCYNESHIYIKAKYNK